MIARESFNILFKILRNMKFYKILVILFIPLHLKKELSLANIQAKRNGKE
jgi:hypothetical protein